MVPSDNIYPDTAVQLQALGFLSSEECELNMSPEKKNIYQKMLFMHDL